MSSKKIRALISSIITKDSKRSETISRELVESILLENENTVIESFFSSLRGNKNEK